MRNIALVIPILLFIASCSPVYVPNARNSPLFRKGGEFQGSVQLGTVQLGTDIDAQAAVSVTKHFALMGNFSYADNQSQDQDKYHNHKFVEGAIGYFSNDGKWCYEVFAGYGKGEGSSYDQYDFFNTTTEIKTTGKFTRFFIQPAVGLNKKIVNVSFVPRISLVDFNEFTSDDAVAPHITEGDPKIFIEPAVIGRINFLENRLFFAFQSGASIPTSKIHYEYCPFNVFLGLGFRIGKSKGEEIAY